MDVYEIVTSKIIASLEKGIIPWQKPWSGINGGAHNYVSHKTYSLVNQLILEHQDAYLTFNQAKALGGKIKKGAKAEIVVFWKMFPSKTETVKDENGNETPKMIPMLRYYNVFWIGDCEGIKAEDEAKTFDNDPVEEAEKVISEYLVREPHLKFQNDQPSNEAYYSPASDKVVVPMINQYELKEEYYSTTFHELVHSTGAETRLNRKSDKVAAFGSEEYSKEELVAEMGAAMLVHTVGIESEKSFNNSAAYIQSWLQALRNDKRMVVSAAGKAQKAVEYILGIQV